MHASENCGVNTDGDGDLNAVFLVAPLVVEYYQHLLSEHLTGVCFV